MDLNVFECLHLHLIATLEFDSNGAEFHSNCISIQLNRVEMHFEWSPVPLEFNANVTGHGGIPVVPERYLFVCNINVTGHVEITISPVSNRVEIHLEWDPVPLEFNSNVTGHGGIPVVPERYLFACNINGTGHVEITISTGCNRIEM